MAATAYSAIAKATTSVKPKCIASSVARIALITEAQPLTPHAQGILGIGPLIAAMRAA